MSKYLSNAREGVSSYTHFLGAIAFGVGGVFLFIKAFFGERVSASQLLGLSSFSFSILALYSASAYYHYANRTQEAIARLRKLDHGMIYVLIAGTYTPVVLTYLTPPKGIYFSVFIWSFALVGIVLKLFWMNAPRWLSTALYIIMGWSILFDVSAFANMQGGAMTLLALGGISYTAGGVIYAIKKPNISALFGFHEVFHLFVLLGSFFHFAMVFLYIA